MKRAFSYLLLCIFLFFLLTFSAYADTQELPAISLPSELTDRLGKLPTDTSELASWFSAEKLLDFGLESAQSAFSGAVRCFMKLISVAALCSVMGALCESVKHKGILTAFNYMAVLSSAMVTLSALWQIVQGVIEHMEILCAFSAGIIPVYAGICTAGGMNGLSLVGTGGLALTSSFAALLAAKVLLPLLRVCFVLGFSASVSGLAGISQVAGMVRRFFVGIVGGICALLTSVFAFQSEIAAKADTLGGRAFRYVTASALPLVGGALSEASRTLSSAFSLMGGMVGGVGVAAVVLLLLPILLELWMLRLSFLSVGGIADILSLTRIAGLYRDGGALLGALMAILALVDAVLIFEFALLMRI